MRCLAADPRPRPSRPSTKPFKTKDLRVVFKKSLKPRTKAEDSNTGIGRSYVVLKYINDIVVEVVD